MPVLPLTNFPSLTTIANLTRSLVNDDNPQGGRVLTNSSPVLQNFMNSAIRDLYRDLRIMNQPSLIKDNYLILNLPPVNSSLGVGVPNPAVQVSLTNTGYFDGLQLQTDYVLPTDMIYPWQLWERQSGSNQIFTSMLQATGPLYSSIQNGSLGTWEWRSNQIWMNGATEPRDIRIRYEATYADLAGPDIDWDNTYVPIYDCQEALADKISVRYAQRIGGAALAEAKEQAKMSLLKIRQQNSKQRQKINFQVPAYGQVSGRAAANNNNNILY